MDLIPVKLTLSEAQFDKLRRGHSIQVSKSKLVNGIHTLYVNPTLAKKINKAKKNSKGVRFQVAKNELVVSAEGLKDFLKKARKFYDQHIKSVAGPLLKKGVEGLANAAISEAEAVLPVFKPVLEKGRKFIPGVSKKIGKITGAYGLMQLSCPHCGNNIQGAIHSGSKGGSFKPAGGGIVF